jgi:hypothetical protein
VRGARRSTAARLLLLAGAASAVLASGLIVLALWTTPPTWLAEPRQMTLAGLHWAQTYVLRIAVAASIVGSMRLFGLRRLTRRNATKEQRRVHDRAAMLHQVRHQWIEGVLKQSLASEVRVRLGITLRPDMIQQAVRGDRSQPQLLAVGMPVSRVFDEAKSGLLILGAPGSGKTTVLLELARDLLNRAKTDQTQPIPVVLNLSSWAARRPPLTEWLTDELHNRYSVVRSIAEEWVAARKILPLLDGLDEVATAYHAACIEAISIFQGEHEPARIVVCSRIQEYTALVSQLRVDQAIELQSLTRQQVSDYLAAAGSALADVQAALTTDETLWELLSSPLVLNIVALTYQDQRAHALRSPSTGAQRLTELFTAYTQRMLEHRPGRYTSAQTLHWLASLARQLRERSQTEFRLNHLTPDWLPTTAQRWLATFAPVLSTGLLGWLLSWLLGGQLGGQLGGLFVGLLVGLSLTTDQPAKEIHWNWAGLIGGLVLGLIAGLVFGLAIKPVVGLVGGLLFGLTVGLAVGLISGLASGLIVSLIGGLVGGLLVWLFFKPVAGLVHGLIGGLTAWLIIGLASALTIWLTSLLARGLFSRLTDERSRLNKRIHQSARYALVGGLAAGLASGLFFGLIGALVGGLVSGLIGGLVVGLVGGLIAGLAGGLAVGAVVGLVDGLVVGRAAGLQPYSVRVLLASNGLAPLRYVRFLDEATEQLFLRRVGSGYLFVHGLLLNYFADLKTVPPATEVKKPLPLTR